MPCGSLKSRCKRRAMRTVRREHGDFPRVGLCQEDVAVGRDGQKARMRESRRKQRNGETLRRLRHGIGGTRHDGRTVVDGRRGMRRGEAGRQDLEMLAGRVGGISRRKRQKSCKNRHESAKSGGHGFLAQMGRERQIYQGGGIQSRNAQKSPCDPQSLLSHFRLSWPARPTRPTRPRRSIRSRNRRATSCCRRCTRRSWTANVPAAC